MKKLFLKKQTISNLSQKDMKKVKGGETTLGIAITYLCPNSGIGVVMTLTCPN